MSCPICQTPSGDEPPQRGYRRCGGCGGLSLDPYPRKQQNTVFEGTAGVARQRALEEGRSSYFQRHLQRLERARGTGPNHGRLLEIGCGSGVMLRHARARGWQADALEYSPELADIAQRDNPAAKIIVTDVLAHTSGPPHYDAVIALDVIEHVLDPALMLRNCAGLLRPGGHLLLQTPNTRSLRARLQGADWEMRDPDQHLNLFAPQGLRDLLLASGFVVEAMHTVSGTGLETGWRRTVAAARQWLLDRALLGNALLVVARRTDGG